MRDSVAVKGDERRAPRARVGQRDRVAQLVGARAAAHALRVCEHVFASCPISPKPHTTTASGAVATVFDAHPSPPAGIELPCSAASSRTCHKRKAAPSWLDVACLGVGW